MNQISQTRQKAGPASLCKKLFIILLCLSLFFPSLKIVSLTTEAGVAWPVFGSSRPIKAYTLKTGRTFPVYNKDHKKISGRTYSSSDVIHITAIRGKWVSIQYPSGKEMKSGYTQLSNFTTASSPQSVKVIQADIKAYRNSTGTKTAAAVAKGSTMYTLCSMGTRIQVLYSVVNSSGSIKYWQIGWVDKADQDDNNLISVQSSSTLRITGVARPTTISQGAPFDVTGTVLSNHTIKKVRVEIQNASHKSVSKRTVYPNSKSYALSRIDNYIRFDYAKPGKNYYIIYAKDTKKSTTLTIPFNVTKKSAVSTPTSGKAGGSSYVLGYEQYTGVKYKTQTSDRRRIAALEKAKKMATVKWKCPMSFPTWYNSEGYYSTVTAKDGTVSSQFLKGKIYVGIPYSMVNHSYDNSKWNSFIKNKFTWNDISKAYYSYTYKTTAKGSDCSYFVYLCMRAAGANVTYQTTYTMYNGKYYKRISMSSLKPGDILLRSDHVRLYAGKVGSKYAVFEATGNGSKTRYKLFSSSDLSGYSAYRYKKW